MFFLEYIVKQLYTTIYFSLKIKGEVPDLHEPEVVKWSIVRPKVKKVIWGFTYPLSKQ